MIQPVKTMLLGTLAISIFLPLACHKQTDTPTPYSQQPVATQKSINSFPNIPLGGDLFADFPTVFPESSQYHLYGIDVSSTTDTTIAFSIRLGYNQRNQIAYKNFYDYRQGKAWQHKYTFDDMNRLVQDASVGSSFESGDYPARTNYTYDGDKVVKIVRNTASPHNPLSEPTPNRTTTYRYDGNRASKAVILNYYVTEPQENSQYAQDSTRRQFTYTDNGLTTVVNDSLWGTPCFYFYCGATFIRVNQISKRTDTNGYLVSASTSAYVYAPLYPNGNALFTNEYNGPNGLISRQVNTSAGLVYQFLYQKK